MRATLLCLSFLFGAVLTAAISVCMKQVGKPQSKSVLYLPNRHDRSIEGTAPQISSLASAVDYEPSNVAEDGATAWVRDVEQSESVGSYATRDKYVSVSMPDNDLAISSQPAHTQSPLSRLPRGKLPAYSLQTSRGQFSGLLLGLFSDQTLLLQRDGSILTVDNGSIDRSDYLNEAFRSISTRELASQLQREFGNEYRVQFESPYLIVAHSDTMRKWSQRFRSFHHSIKLYCTTRGIEQFEPEFPLTAVVFGSQREFFAYARAEQANLPAGCVGYYSQYTNRIVLFESNDERAIIDTLETICHEATHQLAFNTGLHQRMAPTPLWVAEGFATMFESPSHSNLVHRDNASSWPRSQRANWDRLIKDKAKVRELVDALIRSDRPFETDTLNAYTISWAMSSYLSQRQSRAYGQYLKRISELAPFADYSAAARRQAFSQSFNVDLSMLVREIVRHVESLP